MLDDVDASIAAFLTATMPAHPPVVFEPSSTKPRKPTLRLALYRLAEEIDGVGAAWEDRRDDEGRVILRERSPRRFRLTYLVDAEADHVAGRHGLIGAALRTVIDYDEVPPEYFTGALDPDLPMLVRPAPVPDSDNIDAVMAIDVVVAVRPTPSTDIAPPAHELDLSVAKTEPPMRLSRPTAPGGVAMPTGPADRKWTAYRVRETAKSRDD